MPSQVTLPLQPLHKGGVLRRGQALPKHVHDCGAVALQQGIGMQPESWKNA